MPVQMELVLPWPYTHHCLSRQFHQVADRLHKVAMDKAGGQNVVEASKRFDSLALFASQSKLHHKTFITAQGMENSTFRDGVRCHSPLTATRFFRPRRPSYQQS